MIISNWGLDPKQGALLRSVVLAQREESELFWTKGNVTGPEKTDTEAAEKGTVGTGSGAGEDITSAGLSEAWRSKPFFHLLPALSGNSMCQGQQVVLSRCFLQPLTCTRQEFTVANYWLPLSRAYSWRNPSSSVYHPCRVRPLWWTQ